MTVKITQLPRTEREKIMDRASRLAEDHWTWLHRLLRLVYTDAMIHGYLHGHEDATKKNEEEATDEAHK